LPYNSFLRCDLGWLWAPWPPRGYALACSNNG